ncbi:NAD(P)H-hydrate dehydratase [Anaeromicropila populeti]|uniref:Bifunctional NAD(P)H-hydrate repair enzyme n=1 Tax=Anaeromicropila populeti TaxID=37658 RepID=A0A1I6J8G8_9FIRM|nr:NAD(P)H-hydrate dehydratase [Anaeromicropila populeti]SFR75266.1 NAD(P)H-hydrate epimerase [Anaeromicropila populeti]
MRYVVNSEQMRAIDQYSIEQVGIPAMVLMEKSALSVASVMMEKVSRSDRILAVCGTGNNGGDGIASARILKEEGFQVEVLIIGDEKRATEQTKNQLRIARNLGVSILNTAKVSEYNVIIDAIFGIGIKKTVAGAFEAVINSINEANNTVFSVDVPSGINSNDGKIMNVAVKADYTITFGYHKFGTILYPGCEYAGKIIVADIGFPKNYHKKFPLSTFIFESEDISLLPERRNYSNKGSFGRVLIIAGSRNMSGACYLSAKSAYRSGAGLVKVLTVKDNRNIMQTLLPEALLATYDPLNLKNKMEMDRIVSEIKWATTVVIGPGIGIMNSSECLLDIVLNHTDVPVLIDADGLTMLSGKEKYIKKVSEENKDFEINLPDNVIITPHLKEMERLTNLPVEQISEQIVDIAKTITKNKSFVLALKDARTVVTNGEQTYINISGNNGMATGGSGDVLTGIIAAFLAQGMEKFVATALGVYVHGLAADYAVKGKSTYALMASDIAEALPYILLNK